TGCSTTQTIVRSRRASSQIEQSSSSVRLPHSLQKRTRSFTSSTAAASASASSLGALSRWNASLCAVRVPTPGRRVSCATRLSTVGETTGQFCLWCWSSRFGAARGLELGDPLASELAHLLGELGLNLEHSVELRAAQREAAHRALRDDPRPSQPVVFDERDLADHLAGPELALQAARLDADRAVADHEQPGA